MTHRFLFEDEDTELVPKRARKKKVAEETPAEKEIRRMIDVSVGEFSAQIPESALDTVVAFIRELLMADMNTTDVIELILTHVRESGRSAQEIELISKILNAIDKKFDPEFINKIPSTFPFLAAVGQDAYALSNLKPESLALLNFNKKKIGRGEVAIPLLWGIDKFAADDDTEQKGINSYDLVYKGQRADIKDYRTDTGGKLKDTKELRLGEPASDLFIENANQGFDSSPIKFVKNLEAADFTSQQTGSDKIVELFIDQLRSLSIKKLKLMTKSDVEKELNDAIDSIIKILDTAVRDTIGTEYPGGFFTISELEIRIVHNTGFGFNRLPGGKRLVVSSVSDENPLTNFGKGLRQQVNNRLESIYGVIEAKTKRPMNSGTIQDVIKKTQDAEQEGQAQGALPTVQQPESSDAAQEEITEALLRRLIRSL